MEKFQFSETQKEIADLAYEIADKKIKPIRAEYDEKGEMPLEIVKEFKNADLFGLYLPEEYGGLGGGATELCIAVEQISRVCGGTALALATSALAAMPLLLWGSDEQRKKWLPSVASGNKLAAFALTEAEAGSDATAIKTTAVKKGNYYIVNGTKQFISSAKHADIYTVAVSTNPSRGARGISLLILEKGMDGFTFGKKEEKMGIRSNPTYELNFENVKVPSENLIASEGRGLFVVQDTLDCSRPGVAAQSIGIARGALDETVNYLRTRKQFGQPIISFQAIGHKVADLFTQLDAAKCMLYTFTRHMDKVFIPAIEMAVKNKTTVISELKKLRNQRWTKDSAMVKIFASDIAVHITETCVSLCGGIGYMKDFPVEKYMRDAKITQIYEGTNHILRNEIASAIIKEYAAEK